MGEASPAGGVGRLPVGAFGVMILCVFDDDDDDACALDDAASDACVSDEASGTAVVDCASVEAHCPSAG